MIRQAILVLLPALAPALACRMPAPTWAACARIQDRAIDECSGIVESRRYPGVFWVHNDSGDVARFFGIDARGDLLAEMTVLGATNVDWEDIAVDDSGQVYLGDFGNNRNSRRDLVIYVVDEPDPHVATSRIGRVSVKRRLPFHFPDQRAFPDSTHYNFDCEAMFWRAGSLYVLTKHRSDLNTTLYRLDPNHAGEQVAVRLGEFAIGSPVTAADCSRDGQVLAVLSYHYIHLFEWPAHGDNPLTGRMHRTVVEGRQCEGLCFDADRILFTNEQSEIYCVPVNYLWAQGRYLPDPPQISVPRIAPTLDGEALEWPSAAGTLRFDRFVERPSPASGRGDSIAVRVGWCPQGLVVYADVPDWLDPEAACARAVVPDRPFLWLMVGTTDATRPCLGAGQTIWVVRAVGDSLALGPATPESGQERCAAAQPAAAVRFASRREDAPGRTTFAIEMLLPIPGQATLSTGGEIAFDVALVVPGCRGTATYGWAAARDMQPLGNPLLWGRLRLQAPAATGVTH